MLTPTRPVTSPTPARAADLSAAEARRIALGAQGLAGKQPSRPAGRATLLRTIDRLGLLQLDSVSAVVRAHYLPLFSRLGAYDRDVLDALAGHASKRLTPRRRRLFEYWAHEASLLPVELQPLLRWRMARAARGEGVWKGVRQFARERPDVLEQVLREVTERGPLRVAELPAPGTRRTGWWGWNEGKVALEWLFWTGRLTAAGRRGFERVYDLPERVLPPSILTVPTPPEADAQRALVRHAATALGVATEADLRDYFRLPVAATKARIAELVEDGALVPVAVEGWRQPAFLAAGARIPRRATGAALLAPFDPLVWHRPRTERLFGFRYRIEIYVPAHKRAHGYYVLPFLLRDRLVARVDLKSDRAGGRLIVKGANLEPDARVDLVAPVLRDELQQMANWLRLERLAVCCGGLLAASLRS
jgi:uncharacterized protein YcaQ